MTENAANVKLSDEERWLLGNTEWLIRKVRIQQKIIQLFEILQQEAVRLCKEYHQLPEPFQMIPKISRGEAYQGLPYAVLDYPRSFEKNNMLAMRWMCWWGHEFSFSLILSGRWMTLYNPVIFENWPAFSERGYQFCIHETPWEHTFNPLIVKACSAMPADEAAALALGHGFLKLSKKIPLKQWDDSIELFLTEFRWMLELIDQAPKR